MGLGIIKSLTKSWKLRQLSKRLSTGRSLDYESLIQDFVKGGPSDHDLALEELISMVQNDPDLKSVVVKYNVSRETLKEVFNRLIRLGAGQWLAGHYVPASVLVFGSTLDYVLRNLDAMAGYNTALEATSRLMDYFQRGEMGVIADNPRWTITPKDLVERFILLLSTSTSQTIKNPHLSALPSTLSFSLASYEASLLQGWLNYYVAWELYSTEEYDRISKTYVSRLLELGNGDKDWSDYLGHLRNRLKGYNETMRGQDGRMDQELVGTAFASFCQHPGNTQVTAMARAECAGRYTALRRILEGYWLDAK